MGCSLFSNFHLQMGVTVMGFAEHFGPDLIIENLEYLHVLNKKRRSVLRFGNAVQVFLKVGQLRIVVWFLDRMCNLHPPSPVSKAG